MKRLFVVTAIAALVASAATLPWSANAQTVGGGGGGTSGSGATSGAGAGTAGAAGAAPGAGTTGQAGANAGAGAAATQNATGAAQPGANIGTAGQSQVRAGQGVQTSPVFDPTRQDNLVPPVTNQRPFFSDPQVQRELGLNQNQINQLNQAHENAFSGFQHGVAGLDASLTPDERALRMRQLQNQFDTDFSGNLGTTFTDPRMMQRFNQLNLQSQGFNAFLDPSIQQQLNLTAQQRAQLRQLANQWREQLRDLRTTGRNSQTNQQQIKEMQAQFAQQVNNILNPQQQQQWTAIIGDRFDFRPDFRRDIFTPVFDPTLQFRFGLQDNTGQPAARVPQTGATQPRQQVR
jgi:hypothetical protein